MCFILAFKKNVLSLHHQKVIWCDEFVAQQVEHNTFNVGVLGSSPSEFTRRQSLDCRLFCLWCNYVATDKMSIIDRMQAFSKYPFYRDMQSISTTNKNRELVGGFLLRVTSVVYSRTAYGDYGTPSVMAKAIRAL